MVIITPSIFRRFPEIVFGFNAKIGLRRKSPYFFNLSYSVGDDEKIVDENRDAFFSSLGYKKEKIAYQKQIHSDIITYADKAGLVGESDALITDKKNLPLVISAADCAPIFIYDKKNKLIAGVHSGWRGTEQKILTKTLKKLSSDFNSSPENLFVYIGPRISQKNYEVGEEVAEKFDPRYVKKFFDKLFLDIGLANLDMLSEFEIPENQIQLSSLCTFKHNNLLHSYRRDGERSGRSIGVIALKS